jgi:putative ABC transport system permease protein
MMFGESLRIALSMLRQNKLRSFLTMLGVIIGVMSVTIIVMVSNGFQFFMTSQFQKVGADTIIVMYDPFRQMRGESLGGIEGLKSEDVDYLMNNVSSIQVASPILESRMKASYLDKELGDAKINGTDEKYAEMNSIEMASGRFLTKDDVKRRANVCIIGEEVQSKLFGKTEPVGKYITFAGITLEVIGVVKRLDLLGNSNSKDVVVPLTTVQDKWLGGDKITYITAKPKTGAKSNEVMDAIWVALMHKSGNKPIYRVDSNESFLGFFNSVFGVAGVVLSAIAALSLLVGGIGIMNIMLVSVTERTKEIGLRKAVGAKRSSILIQFLIEAAVLSLVGGLIGMGFAWLLGNLVTLATSTMNWPSKGGLATPFPIVAGIASGLFSAFIGMVFGLYPAISASQLDPIVALRRE